MRWNPERLKPLPKSADEHGRRHVRRVWGSTQYVREFVMYLMPEEGWFTVKEISEMIGHPDDPNKKMRGADLSPILHNLQDQYLVVKSTVHFGPKGERLWARVKPEKPY